MANCSEYMELSPKEKIELTGKMIHAMQSSSSILASCRSIIEIAEAEGLFEGVTINPSEANGEDKING